MKHYDNDAEVLALAFNDGVRERMIAARHKPTTSVYMLFPRVFIVHTAPGDDGFTCFEAANISEWFDLIGRLPGFLGTMSDIRLEPTENTGPGARH